MMSSVLLGNLMHTRKTPVKNVFTYPVFYLLLDLDELGEISRKLSWFGLNRFAPVSFHDKDHLGDPDTTVKESLFAFLQENGHRAPNGRILLLTLPRVCKSSKGFGQNRPGNNGEFPIVYTD